MAKKTRLLVGRELDHGGLSFETEGRLLQELGERLVASPEVALVELIKNAYDADAKTCEVQIGADGVSLEVRDDGHGMTLDQFSARWMRIATSHKLTESTSPLYGRRRTGQKGIGRFAVRFLGSTLTLISVAIDASRKIKTRLETTFDWQSIDASLDLRNAVIPYKLFVADSEEPTGTVLHIHSLKQDVQFVTGKKFRTSVLRIVTPIEGLDQGRFGRSSDAKASDPGFRVLLPGIAEGAAEENLASEILKRAWARLSIDLKGNRLKFSVRLAEGEAHKQLSIPIKSRIDGGLSADIRFFPRRAGVFKGASFDGRAAWSWVRENSGIGVVDHGFRIKPYGFEENDWLSLDYDAAHNRRDWRSPISVNNYPIPNMLRNRPADNPALNLPNNFQLVGAVFVESSPPAVTDQYGNLTPSMDREGYLDNDAYRQLVEVVRAGVEFLAFEDKRDLLERKEAQAKQAARKVRADFKIAVEWIQGSSTLTRGDKSRLVEHYADLARKLDEVEQYDRDARRKLETMSLLGVVAGFMTHEAARILDGLDQAIDRLKAIGRKDAKFLAALKQIEGGYAAFKGHVDYTSTFVDSLHNERVQAFKSGAQVRRVIQRFGTFASSRGIVVTSEIARDLETPTVSIALYSGVLLNLYTNALKAVLAAEGRAESPHIVFRGWNDSKRHYIAVSDKGVGIPPELHKRIFDPLFTTTSNLNNPLGSGMGLGLSLVRELVNEIGGAIRLVDPPSGFSTCFRLELPRN